MDKAVIDTGIVVLGSRSYVGSEWSVVSGRWSKRARARIRVRIRIGIAIGIEIGIGEDEPRTGPPKVAGICNGD